MPDSLSGPWVRRLPAIAGGLAVAVGGTALLGWALNIDILTSVLPNAVSMKPNTALAFTLGGASLWLSGAPSRGIAQRLSVIGAAVVGAIGLLTLLEYVFGLDLGIDHLLIHEPAGAVSSSTSGRMAASTALSFLLLSVPLLRRNVGAIRSRPLVEVCAIIPLLIALMFLSGYANGASALTNITSLIPMAFNTALGFVALGAGVLARDHDGPLMELASSDGPAGLIVRRLLPTMALIILLVSWLRHQGERAGLYDSGLGVALMSLVSIVALGVAAFWSAAALRRGEAARQRSIQALNVSENRYQLLIDNMLSGYAYCRVMFADGRPVDLVYLTVNRAFGTLTGLKDVVGRTASDVMPGFRERDPASLGAYGRVARTGVPERLERYVEELQMWFDISVYSHQADHVALVFDVITDRKRAEQALRQLASLVDAAEDAIIGKTVAGIIKSWNPAAERLFGYRADEIIGAPVTTLFPADRLAEEVAIMERVRRGERLSPFETVRCKRDGSLVQVSASISPIRDGTDAVTGVSTILRDITERKRADEVLRESERRFRQLAEGLPLLVWTCDATGTCDYLSPQWVAYTGIPEAPQLGAGWLEQLHPEDRPATVTAWTDALAKGGPLETEFRIRRADGTYRWFKTRATALRNDAGHIVKWFGTSTDIDDRLQTEQALTRSNADLEQFAYVASHDLQEPLRMVGSYVQILAKRYRGKLDADADDFIGFAVEGATRMQRLIEELLAYSRVGTRGKALMPVPAQLALNAALAALKLAIEESGAVVTSDPLPIVLADPGQLEHLLINLIGNALKFRNPTPPRIHVGAVRDGAQWILSVRDNGIGIDPQYFDKIFLLFQRLNGRLEYPGTGMGLAIAKRIVERHNGRIWVDSQPGAGATFAFTLPASIEAAG